MSEARTALITGASSGIGEAFARRLAYDGYDLIVVARREDRLRALKTDLEDRYAGTVTVLVADLTTDEGMSRTEAAIRDCDSLTMLINNAGFNHLGWFHEVPLERNLAMIQLHLTATTRLCYAALPTMIERQRGDIINVSSMAGIMVFPKSGVYNATKAGITALSESLNLEMAQHSIRVQALLPGFTKTDIVNTEGLKDLDPADLPAFMWMEVGDVVTASLVGLESNRAIVAPGFYAMGGNGIMLSVYRRVMFPLLRRYIRQYKFYG